MVQIPTVKYNDVTEICNTTLVIYPFCSSVSKGVHLESHVRAKRSDVSGAETPKNCLCPPYISLLADGLRPMWHSLKMIAHDGTTNPFHSPSKDGILTNNCSNSGAIQDALTKTLCLTTNKSFVNKLKLCHYCLQHFQRTFSSVQTVCGKIYQLAIVATNGTESVHCYLQVQSFIPLFFPTLLTWHISLTWKPLRLISSQRASPLQ